jgi:hypothetical protein
MLVVWRLQSLAIRNCQFFSFGFLSRLKIYDFQVCALLSMVQRRNSSCASRYTNFAS